MAPAARGAAIVLAAAIAGAACGKKGPPLAPLYLVPAAPADVAAHRVEDRVRLRFVLPSRNENGPGVNLDRVEIYAVTVPPGGETPPNRELLTKTYLAGQIPVRPPAEEGQEPDKADERPAPGEAVTFVEEITPAVLQPPPRKRVPAPAPPAGVPATDPGSGLPVTPLQPKPALTEIASAAAHPVRVYVVRGIARNGRPGAPSSRIQVPLGSVPAPPRGLRAQNAENAVALEWLPVLASVGAKMPAYNVYESKSPVEPLNPAPLEAPAYEQRGAPVDEEICFQARTIDRNGPVPVEGPLSEAACVTPKDVFPPAPPKGLAAVSTPGAMQLIWDASPESDLAGYIILRAEGPDQDLQPLTPAPIRDTVFRDETVKPDVRYVYAVVAVDSATPANRSAPSERVEAIGR